MKFNYKLNIYLVQISDTVQCDESQINDIETENLENYLIVRYLLTFGVTYIDPIGKYPMCGECRDK